MFFVGSIEWWYLFRLTTSREPKTKIAENEVDLTKPVAVDHDNLIARERDRSREDDDGINARDLV